MENNNPLEELNAINNKLGNAQPNINSGIKEEEEEPKDSTSLVDDDFILDLDALKISKKQQKKTTDQSFEFSLMSQLDSIKQSAIPNIRPQRQNTEISSEPPLKDEFDTQSSEPPRANTNANPVIPAQDSESSEPPVAKNTNNSNTANNQNTSEPPLAKPADTAERMAPPSLNNTKTQPKVPQQNTQNKQPSGNTRQTPIVNSQTQPQKKDKQTAEDSVYHEEFEQTVGRGIIKNTVKAVIYLVCILVVSGCLALVGILVANDCFAFVKGDQEINVIIPENASLNDIAKILGDNQIIKYPQVFTKYCELRHKTADTYLSGEFTFSPSMSYDKLIAAVKPMTGVRKEITLTIVEGMSVDDIIELFVNNGIGSTDRFKEVIQTYDFDYWFVDELDALIAENPDSGRKYRLEGYLFPDTYNFYSTASEEDCISKLLDNFNVKFDDDKRTRARELDMTCDEIVTMASIIQKEAKYISDYANVSSVFHNRLNTRATNHKLESNATVQYTMPKEEVELKLTNAQIEQYDNAYNTYLYPGLPVGAICNPSLNALQWALYPSDTNYLYFVSDAEGYNLYASSYSQHQRNVEEVEAEMETAQVNG